MRIGTVVMYRLPPKGRRKKKTNWKEGVIVGMVDVNQEPSANLDQVMYVGWKNDGSLSMTKEVEGSARSEPSFLVMDSETKKVHWPPVEDVIVYTGEPIEIEEEDLLEEAEALEEDVDEELINLLEEIDAAEIEEEEPLDVDEG